VARVGPPKSGSYLLIVLLMMGILVPETCWGNKTLSHLVGSLFSVVTNDRFSQWFCRWKIALSEIWRKIFVLVSSRIYKGFGMWIALLFIPLFVACCDSVFKVKITLGSSVFTKAVIYEHVRWLGCGIQGYTSTYGTDSRPTRLAYVTCRSHKLPVKNNSW
jgi:hypothetical protein